MAAAPILASADVFDELPPPERPPLVDSSALRQTGRYGDIRALMRALSKRYF